MRLRKSADFRAVSRQGRRLIRGPLVVLYLPRPDAGPRFGLAVSRRVGNSVVRNRVKRWLRESIRGERGDLSAHDVVFIARRHAATAGFMAIRGHVAAALQHIAEGG